MPPSLIASAQTTDWNPALRDVDAPNETVAAQVDKIIRQDSPLSQAARTSAAQAANARGLGNSSMAVQAGEQAVINSALPIASADAATYTAKSRDNQAALNAAGQFNAGERNQTSRFNAGEENAASKMVLGADLEKSLIGSRTDAQSRLQSEQATQQQALQDLRGQQETALQRQRGEQETSLQTLRGTQEQQLQTMRGEQAKVLADIEASNRTLIQSSQQAATLYSDIQRQIAAVQADVNLSAAQKQTAVDRLTNQLETGLALFGGMANVDIRGLLNFGGSAAPAAGAGAGAAASYLQDKRVATEVGALRAAMQKAGITTLSQQALEDPAVASAYNALNAKINAVMPGNSFPLMQDFKA